MIDFLRRNVRWVAPAAVAGLAAVAWLAFGYFGVHTLFIDDEVTEADPFAVTAADATSEAAASAPEATEAAAEPAAEEPTSQPEGTTAPTEEPDAAAATAEAQEVTVATTYRGDFFSLAHGTSGAALVRTDGTQTFLRFEGFETDNGPDLNVYLVRTDPANGGVGEDYLDLGDLKGNVGDQNYEIPAGVDLSEYSGVVIWCVRFGVAFGGAPLTGV